jgi:hypothetical protein
MLFEKIQMEPDEKVLVMVRKHWFVIMAELFGSDCVSYISANICDDGCRSVSIR